jgi:hypothetical protein
VKTDSQFREPTRDWYFSMMDGEGVSIVARELIEVSVQYRVIARLQSAISFVSRKASMVADWDMWQDTSLAAGNIPLVVSTEKPFHITHEIPTKLGL